MGHGPTYEEQDGRRVVAHCMLLLALYIIIIIIMIISKAQTLKKP